MGALGRGIPVANFTSRLKPRALTKKFFFSNEAYNSFARIIINIKLSFVLLQRSSYKYRRLFLFFIVFLKKTTLCKNEIWRFYIIVR